MSDPAKPWDGQSALLNAKRELYYQILRKPNELWTENELELGHRLVLDTDIQKLLDERIKKEADNGE